LFIPILFVTLQQESKRFEIMSTAARTIQVSYRQKTTEKDFATNRGNHLPNTRILTIFAANFSKDDESKHDYNVSDSVI